MVALGVKSASKGFKRASERRRSSSVAFPHLLEDSMPGLGQDLSCEMLFNIDMEDDNEGEPAMSESEQAELHGAMTKLRALLEPESGTEDLIRMFACDHSAACSHGSRQPGESCMHCLARLGSSLEQLGHIVVIRKALGSLDSTCLRRCRHTFLVVGLDEELTDNQDSCRSPAASREPTQNLLRSHHAGPSTHATAPSTALHTHLYGKQHSPPHVGPGARPGHGSCAWTPPHMPWAGSQVSRCNGPWHVGHHRPGRMWVPQEGGSAVPSYYRGGNLWGEVIVDPWFKDQLTVPRPGPVYSRLLEAVPPAFVGTPQRLARLVSFLNYFMQRSLQDAGLSLPPWRECAVMVARWLPAEYQDISPMDVASGSAMTVASHVTPARWMQGSGASPGFVPNDGWILVDEDA